jgi:6-phosphogluconolactonase
LVSRSTAPLRSLLVFVLAAHGCGGGADTAPDGGGDSGRTFVYVSGGSTISVFSLNAATGALTARGSTTAAGKNVSFLAHDPGARRLFALNEATPGLVVAFSVDDTSGALTRLNDTPSGGDAPAQLAVDRSGKWLLVANYDTGSVATIPIGADGKVGAFASRHDFGVSSAPHLAVVGPANRFVLVACKGLDQIGQLRFAAVSGALTANDPAFVATPAMAHPRHLAFHPGGGFVYAINETSNTMDAFGYDDTSGRLTPLQTLSTLPQGFSGGSAAAEVQVHPSGRFLYGSNRGHDSIVIYRLDAQGRMTLIGHETGGGLITTPRSFAIDPTGRYLLVGNQAGAVGILVFRIDGATGRLMRIGKVSATPSAVYVGVTYMP